MELAVMIVVMGAVAVVALAAVARDVALAKRRRKAARAPHDSGAPDVPSR